MKSRIKVGSLVLLAAAALAVSACRGSLGTLTLTPTPPGAPTPDTVVTIGAREAEGGGVTVTVNSVDRTPQGGITINYTVVANSKYLGEMAPPKLLNASGQKVRPVANPDTGGLNQSSGASSNPRRATFAPAPTGEYRLVFGPFVVSSASTPVAIEIPAATFREAERITGRAQQPAVKVLIPFEVNGGQYAITEIELTSFFTGFYFEPQDTVAAGVLPIGTTTTAVLTDNTGRRYTPSTGAAKWGSAVDGRMDVVSQYMRFEGAPGPEVETLTLLLDGHDVLVDGEWTFPITVVAATPGTPAATPTVAVAPTATPTTPRTPTVASTVDSSKGTPQLRDAQTLFSFSTSVDPRTPTLCSVSPYDGTMAVPGDPTGMSGDPCGSGTYRIVGLDWTPGAPPLAEVPAKYEMDAVLHVWSKGNLLLVPKGMPLPVNPIMALSLDPPRQTVPLVVLDEPRSRLAPVGWLDDGASAVYVKQAGDNLSLHAVALNGTEVLAVDLGTVLAGQSNPLARVTADGAGVVLQTSPQRGEARYTRFDPKTRSFSLIKDVSIENSLPAFFWVTPDGGGVVLFDGGTPGENRWYHVPLGEGAPRELDVRNGGFWGAFAKDGWAVFGVENRIVAVDLRTGESRVLAEEEGRVLGPFLAGESALAYEVVVGETRHVKRALVD